MFNKKFIPYAVTHIAPVVFAILFLVGCGSISKNGNTLSTNPGAPTPAYIPAAPAQVVATAASAQISCSWSASSAATSYHVDGAGSASGPDSTIAVPSVDRYSDPCLANST